MSKFWSLWKDIMKKKNLRIKRGLQNESAQEAYDDVRKKYDVKETGIVPYDAKAAEESKKRYARQQAQNRQPEKIEADDSGKLKISRAGVPWGGIAIALIIIVPALLIGLWASGNQAVASFFDVIGASGPLNQFSNQVAYAAEYTGCLIDNSNRFSFGDPTAGSYQSFVGGNLFEVCDQLLGVNAQDIGCTECFDLSLDTPNPRIYAGVEGQKAILRAFVSAQTEEFTYTNFGGEVVTQPVTPAVDANVQLTLDGIEGDDIQGRCISGCELDPAILPYTLVGTFDGDNFCGKGSVQGKGVLSYAYRTEGSASINILAPGAEDVFFQSRNPISLPGPVKLDIVPDKYQSGDGYNIGFGDNLAFVSIRFRNAGAGEATITGLELDQITPEGFSDLKFSECFGPISSGFTTSGDKINVLTEGDVIKLGSNAKSATIICTIDLSGAELSGDVTSYIITGSATYNYELTRRSQSIFVDSLQCASTSSSSDLTTTSSGGGGGGGSTCAAEDVAPLSKQCPDGKTFQENGCCV